MTASSKGCRHGGVELFCRCGLGWGGAGTSWWVGAVSALSEQAFIGALFHTWVLQKTTPLGLSEYVVLACHAYLKANSYRLYWLFFYH
jgi:hypothetical protein